MTGQEARAMTDEKLASEVKALRAQLFTLRSQAVTEKVEDNSQFRKIRRDIARLLQAQGERRTAASGPKTDKTPKAPGRKPAGKAGAKPSAKAPAKAKS